ncbi:uncharacterized protein C22orf15 homolog isoform X1 [Ailuropoda melanoleuca]|uniref:uncharacterized protein C22orf15 homolog isoform X1 n=1 Tax=Ailuropoda melanoleuca TaxID=9646 RepID=UPI00149407FF|nr:uncharacterized protein C22orf15 homolog isoform X1 [Ailuropoda melanoleuca]
MFIKVMFGAGCWELVNTWCSPVTLTAHLRQRGKVPQDAIIALLAEDGHLVSLDEGLEEGASQAPSMGSPLLQERGTYVLVQIIKGEGGAPTRYESLLENLDDQYPELAESGFTESCISQRVKVTDLMWGRPRCGCREKDTEAETRRVKGASLPESGRQQSATFMDSSPRVRCPWGPCYCLTPIWTVQGHQITTGLLP